MVITLNYEEVRQLVAESFSRRFQTSVAIDDVEIVRSNGREDVEVRVEVGIDAIPVAPE